MAYGNVALGREGGYGQDRGVSGGLGGQAPEHAEGLAEYIRVPAPNLIDLDRHPRDQQQQVRYGQAEEVVVRGGVHGLVPGYDHAGAYVANRARNEDRGVDYAYGYDHVQGVAHRAVHVQEVSLEVFPAGRVLQRGLGAVVQALRGGRLGRACILIHGARGGLC